MIINFLIFTASLLLVIRGAMFATKYAAKLSKHFHLSIYVIGFIVAGISILPETIISINSAIQGIPEFGLGALLGSNVAKLSLILALVILISRKEIKIKKQTLQNISFYPWFLLVPIIFGLNGHFSRTEGLLLIAIGIFFYYLVFKKGGNNSITEKVSKDNSKLKSAFLLLLGVVLMLLGAHFTVSSVTNIAVVLGIAPILIGIIVVSVGTSMPELFFSLKSAKKGHGELAIGNILGSVLADSTIVIGILASISPFYFPSKIIYITGFFMIISCLLLFKYMRSNEIVTRKEAFLLLSFWLAYVVLEFIVNK